MSSPVLNTESYHKVRDQTRAKKRGKTPAEIHPDPAICPYTYPLKPARSPPRLITLLFYIYLFSYAPKTFNKLIFNII